MYNYSLLKHIADGKFHSGEQLSLKLGVSRTTINKDIEYLIRSGLDIFKIKGKGYCWHNAMPLLDNDKIADFFSEYCFNAEFKLPEVIIKPCIDSTNNYLRQVKSENNGSNKVCVAEMQSQGRGRQGKEWFSPLASNLYFSLYFRTYNQIENISCLSLVFAVALANTLARIGITGHKIKWPNDIYCNGKKLAGILVECSGEMSGPLDLIIGIGVNFQLPRGAALSINQPCIDLSALGASLDRNLFVALLIYELLKSIECYSLKGFNFYKDLWAKYDYLYGKQITLNTQQGALFGVAAGVNLKGELLLNSADGIKKCRSGETTLIRDKIL